MNTLLRGLSLLILLSAAADSSLSSESQFLSDSDQLQDLPRYVVFPGLDADGEEIAEWNVGFASPFNVFFGPKPYILGWVGEGGFAPTGEEEEEEIEGEEGDYEEEEGEEEVEGEAEGEEGDLEGEEEAVDPDYDYEKL